MSELLYALIINTNSRVGEFIDELLPSIDLYPTSYFDSDEDIARLNLYFEDKKEADSTKALISESLVSWAEFSDIKIDAIEIVIKTIKQEDWSESWKAFFNVDKVSNRLVIKPSWKEYDAKSNEVVLEIDPGMSFGTGSHGTTKACLQFLDEISQPGQSVIDMGCGSGILSLAASKLGLKPIHAFDYDLGAVNTTRENLLSAGVELEEIYQQDLSEFKSGSKFDIVIANILAPVLMMNSSNIVTALKQGASSRLILSGILHRQFDEIVECFEDEGLILCDKKEIDEWSSGLFRWK